MNSEITCSVCGSVEAETGGVCARCGVVSRPWSSSHDSVPFRPTRIRIERESRFRGAAAEFCAALATSILLILIVVADGRDPDPWTAFILAVFCFMGLALFTGSGWVTAGIPAVGIPMLVSRVLAMIVTVALLTDGSNASTTTGADQSDADHMLILLLTWSVASFIIFVTLTASADDKAEYGDRIDSAPTI